MYTLSIRDTRVRGGIEFHKHDTWDECHEHMTSMGSWKYLGCFGTGICEYQQGDLIAHIYRS